MRKVLSTAMACAMMLALAVPTFAAGTSIDAPGGTGTTPVVLTAEATTFNVTVPTNLPITVAADGKVSVAENAKITNNSFGAVKVTSMTIEGQNTWATVDYDSTEMTEQKVDSKLVAMQINNDKTTGSDTISFTPGNFPKLDGKNDGDTDELKVTYNAKVPAQSERIESETVANVIFTVGWDTAEE